MEYVLSSALNFRLMGFVIIILIQTVLNRFNNDGLVCLMNLTISSGKREEVIEDMHCNCMHAKLKDEHAYQISQTFKLQFQSGDVYLCQPTLRGCWMFPASVR